MSIDLEKNKKEILIAYEDVLSDKTPNDWWVYLYSSHKLPVAFLLGNGLLCLYDGLRCSYAVGFSSTSSNLVRVIII